MERAYTAVETALMPTRPGRYSSSVTRVEFDRLWVMQVEESGPRIKHSVQPTTRAYIKFLTEPQQHFIHSGVEVGSSSIVRHAQGENYFEHSPGPMRWGTISLPSTEMATYVGEMAGLEVSTLQQPLIVTPLPRDMARLQDIFRTVISFAQNSSEVLARHEVARALEQALIEAMLTSFAGQKDGNIRWSHQTHRCVMRRFARFLQGEPDRALYVPEICSAINVPERTLRICCQEHLGMSPKQYLILRKMHLAHRALQAAAPNSTTVSTIANDYGFWHFGRFSVCYRTVFGETPSATLRRRPS